MNLAMYLRVQGLKKEAFAAKIGISNSSLREILNGHIPNLKTALAIELATNGEVTCKELIPKEIQLAIAKGLKEWSSWQDQEIDSEPEKKRKTKKRE